MTENQKMEGKKKKAKHQQVTRYCRKRGYSCILEKFVYL
ncbi:hypothetical protein M949_0452 [Riemerella anatipestifer CH3]|nr:hypothetical protein M949_0452 [Riemerella anatipestifer CH3]